PLSRHAPVFAVWFKVPLDAGILADLAAFVGSARP
ncbi:hypothetical protein ACEP3S_27865, partial [Pseudomonas aeruginosa]